MMIYYVTLPFVRVEGGLAPGDAVESAHAAAAIRRAEALAAGRQMPERSHSRDAVIPMSASRKMR
jgi:hypothetical protein